MAVLEQVRGKAVTQGVARGRLVDAGQPHGLAEDALDGGRVLVGPPPAVPTTVEPESAGREDPLPGAEARGPELGAVDLGRNLGPPPARGHLPAMELVQALQVRPQRAHLDSRQQGDPVLLALAVADHDLTQPEVDVHDPEAGALHQPETGAVHQRRHQPVDAVELGQEAPDFFA